MPEGCAEASAIESEQYEAAKRKSPLPGLLTLLAAGGGGYWLYRRHKRKSGK